MSASKQVPSFSPTGRFLRTIPHLRWYICGLLFFATTVNYIDRQVLGILKPVLKEQLGWGEDDYGLIVWAFQVAYALMMPITGRLIDRMGSRLGYMLAVVIWSIAAMAHAGARNAVQFGIARFALGLGEAANFPAAIRVTADWFPKRERALATGIFNSGSNIGAVLAPALVPWIAVNWGWREAFVITGALGFLWVVLWALTFRPPEEHTRLSREEFALIRSDHAEESSETIPYRRLLATRQAWAFMLGKFLTDPVWWFYLFWLPGFLHTQYKVDLINLGPPLIAIYLAADVGSIGGGWISSALLKRGLTANRARKIAMLICGTAVMSSWFIMKAGGNLWLAVTFVAIAASAHQGWSANIFTMTSDLFPRRAVASVVGLGGMGGAIGGALISPIVGYWLEWSGGVYGPLFIVCGSMYLIALAVIHLILPRWQPAEL